MSTEEMNDRQRVGFYMENGFYNNTTIEGVIEIRVNILLRALYVPVEGHNYLTKTDTRRIQEFGIDDSEPINWGDLKCCGVERVHGGSFLVTIEEASPGSCQSLCDYIERFMKSWGWDVTVETEW